MGCLSTNKLASGLTLRCVHAAFHGCAHEYETPTQAACRIAGEVLAIDQSRIGVTWRGSVISRLLVDGKDAGETVLEILKHSLPLDVRPSTAASDKARRLILVDRLSRLDVTKIAEVEHALDEIEVPAPLTEDDEAHGRTLAASEGFSWEACLPLHRAHYTERARRLRKRWGCGDGPTSDDERVQMSKALLEVCADRDNLYRKKEDLWTEVSELRVRVDEHLVELESLRRANESLDGALARTVEQRDAAVRAADDAAARAERIVVRTEVSVDLMAQEVLRLRSELASAMATLESVALADDNLREVAGRVVGEFERNGTKNVGSLIQDLREALR